MTSPMDTHEGLPSEAAMRAAVDLEIQMACRTVTTRGLALHLDEIARSLGAAQASANPVAWVIPGDDTASDGGWLDARLDKQGEFTRPLYGAPRLATAQTPWPADTLEGREEVARIIYNSFPYDGPLGKRKPDWTPNGNSFMQDKAREAADTIISALRPAGSLRPSTELAADGELKECEHCAGTGRHGRGLRCQRCYGTGLSPSGSPQHDHSMVSSTHQPAPTIDDVPSCGQENDYRRAFPSSSLPARGEEGELRELFADHYWDSFQEQKELIMKHIDAVLALKPHPFLKGE